MTLAAHQPTFFPHYAFFQKMEQSDVFVILNHVQYEKNNYQNRFQLDGKWHTMSVERGLKPIITKRYVNAKKDWERIKSAVPYNIDSFDYCIGDSLAATNYYIIQNIKIHLKINTRLVMDMPTDLMGTHRLVQLCKDYGATKYLSGPSGKKYMDLSLFEKEGIEVVFQEPSESKPILHVLNN